MNNLEVFFKELVQKINKYNTIVIFRHKSPDGDALGSQFGLGKWIENNFKNKQVKYVGENTTGYLKNLFPNINQENEIKGKYLSIVVDTANTERIAGKGWDLAKDIIKIDHHPNNDNYGTLTFVDTTYSSCSEIITELILLNKKNIEKESANYLYIGVVTDTGRFLFNSVNHRTLLLASKLIETGINIENIYNTLYTKDIKIIKYSSFVTSNFKTQNNIAFFVAPKKIENKFNLKYEEVSSQVNLLLQSNNISYAVYLTWNQKDKIWKGSLRSKDKPINKIAEKFNGGGHKNASGFSLKKKKDIKKVIKEISKL